MRLHRRPIFHPHALPHQVFISSHFAPSKDMSQQGPSLGETYTLTELPRVPDITLAERLVVCESQKAKSFASTDSIDLGISKSIISSYVLKPTPKLVWSHPLSPNTVVDSMDVDGNLYVIGVTERKKSKLLLVSRTDEKSITTEIALRQPAIGLKFCKSNKIYVLLKNGEFRVAEYTSTPDLSITLSPSSGNISLPSSGESRVLFHTFINKPPFGHKTDLLFLISKTESAMSPTYTLIALDGSKSFEVYSISGTTDSYSPKVYAYSEGTVYAYDTLQQEITSSLLMKPQHTEKTLSLKSLLRSGEKDELVSMVAVASDRLILSHKDSIFLVNFKFESLLSEHTNTSGNQVYLAFGLPLEENNAMSRNSFALYLNQEKKNKTCKLKLIQVDLGLNLLSESLGKAINKRKEQKWNGVPHLAEEDLELSNAQNIRQMEEVFENLTQARSMNDTEKFDRFVTSFLKNADKSKSVPRYSRSSDRVVDHKFIESILNLVLTFDKEGSVQMISKDFVPVDSLAYLLTHPLFPAKYTKGLLVMLSALDQPALLKLAIDSCRSMNLDELIVEFANLTEVSEELADENEQGSEYVTKFLLATIDRIIKDYSLSQITSKLSDSLTKGQEADSKRLERMLNVLININTNSSWTFVSAVIDVGGLFNWSIPTVKALNEVIDSKIAGLTSNSYNLTLTNQALMAVDPKSKKRNKKFGPKVVDNIHEVTSQRAQLDSILTLSNNTTNKKLIVDEGIELAKQIPSYSRERLVL